MQKTISFRKAPNEWSVDLGVWAGVSVAFQNGPGTWSAWNDLHSGAVGCRVGLSPRNYLPNRNSPLYRAKSVKNSCICMFCTLTYPRHQATHCNPEPLQLSPIPKLTPPSPAHRVHIAGCAWLDTTDTTPCLSRVCHLLLRPTPISRPCLNRGDTQPQLRTRSSFHWTADSQPLAS
jgi:hypothetical protein